MLSQQRAATDVVSAVVQHDTLDGAKQQDASCSPLAYDSPAVSAPLPTWRAPGGCHLVSGGRRASMTLPCGLGASPRALALSAFLLEQQRGLMPGELAALSQQVDLGLDEQHEGRLARLCALCLTPPPSACLLEPEQHAGRCDLDLDDAQHAFLCLDEQQDWAWSEGCCAA